MEMSTPDLAATATTAASPTDMLDMDQFSVTVMPNTGEGEHSMKIFIQEHMTSILQPLAERVTDLSRNLQKTMEDLSLSNDKVERNTDHLHDHDQKIFGLNQGMNRSSEDLKVLRMEMNDLGSKQTSQEGELDLLGATMRKVEGLLGAHSSAARDFEKSLEDMDGRLRQLQLSHSEQNILHMSFSDRLNEIKNFCEGLNDRHLESIKGLQEAKQADENTRNTLKRHINSSDRQKKDDLRSLQLLDERTKAVEAMLLDQNHKIELQGKTVRSTELQMKQVVGDIEQVTGVHSSMESKSRSPTEMLGVRLHRVEESLANVSKREAADFTSMRAQIKDVQDQATRTGSEIEKNNANLDSLAKQVKTHEDRLFRHEDRILAHDAGITRLQKQANQAQADIQHLQNLERELSNQIQMQATEIKKTNMHATKTDEDLESTNRELSDLRDDLQIASTNIEKTSSRMELAHEYLNGLAKGFQDTHKRVTIGADGMVQPKHVQRKMLPEIPGSRSTTPRV